jgi:hypothetical protein
VDALGLLGREALKPHLGCTIAIVRGSIACAVAALKIWLDAAELTTGPVFRSVHVTTAGSGHPA